MYVEVLGYIGTCRGKLKSLEWVLGREGRGWSGEGRG